LKQGDLLVAFTDGLFEVEGKSEVLYDQRMLLEAVRAKIQLPAAVMFDALIGEIKAFSAIGEFDDDVCIVGMEAARL
jgi:serine phosphatase RsbU (regulator of sigma subunit)